MATYEHILKNGNKVQVDSAIRDGDGVNIATKYAKKSELVNFITKTVNDLVNYYKKSETYTKEEVNNKISEIPKFAIKVVAMLPTSNISATTVYLVTSQSSTTQNLYDEYIYVDGKWEKLGSQTIDLSGYLKTHYEDSNQNTANLIATATDIDIYTSGDGHDSGMWANKDSTQIYSGSEASTSYINLSEFGITMSYGVSSGFSGQVLDDGEDMNIGVGEQYIYIKEINEDKGVYVYGDKFQYNDNDVLTTANSVNDLMDGQALGDKVSVLESRVDAMIADKFPNAVRRGTLTINDGQASGFSTENYLMFPFVLDVKNRPFQVDFCFTTGNDVTTQQNVLDSRFGIALAIKNGKGLMAISTNGTSWAGQAVGTLDIEPNTTYYARLTWNRLVYKTQLSIDGVNYIDDMSIVNTVQPYPVTMFIGGASVEDLGHTSTPFFGSIDMNKAYVYVDNILIWHGMISAPLDTLADVSLSNIDEAGKQVIKDNGGTDVKVNNVKQTEINFTSDPQTQLDNKVPTTRTVNGKALSDNITLTAGDVGASTFSGDYNDLSNKPTIPDSYTKTESDGRYVTNNSLSERIKTVRTWQVGYNSSSSSRGWYKFLTFNWDGRNTYANYDMYILVSSTYGNPFSGILHLNPRWDTDALASGMWVEWEWMSGDKQFTADSVKVVRSNNKVECYIYQPINDGWYFIGFSILHESRRIYQMGISYEFATVDTAPLSSVSNVWVTSTKAGNGEDFQLDTEVMTNTKWINGKPIYRLTKLVSLPDSSSWQNLFYLHSSGTINQIIKIEGLLHEGNNYISLPVGEGGVYRNLRWKADTGYIQSVNNGFNGDAYITVYFTRN